MPSFRAKQFMQSNTLVGGSVVTKPEFINHPISNFEIMYWVKYLNIKNFIGVLSRDEIPTKVKIYQVNVLLLI